MTITKNPDAVAVVEPIVEHLQQAWNSGDGMGFAGPFAEDADFVEIRGGHHHGAVAVGRGHEAIFSTIYAGSTVDLKVEMARNVGPGVVVALVHSTMTAPTGPMAGVNQARMTLVLVEEAGSGAITQFHNTLVVGER